MNAEYIGNSRKSRKSPQLCISTKTIPNPLDKSFQSAILHYGSYARPKH